MISTQRKPTQTCLHARIYRHIYTRERWAQLRALAAGARPSPQVLLTGGWGHGDTSSLEAAPLSPPLVIFPSLPFPAAGTFPREPLSRRRATRRNGSQGLSSQTGTNSPFCCQNRTKQPRAAPRLPQGPKQQFVGCSRRGVWPKAGPAAPSFPYQCSDLLFRWGCDSEEEHADASRQGSSHGCACSRRFPSSALRPGKALDTVQRAGP